MTAERDALAAALLTLTDNQPDALVDAADILAALAAAREER